LNSILPDFWIPGFSTGYYYSICWLSELETSLVHCLVVGLHYLENWLYRKSDCLPNSSSLSHPFGNCRRYCKIWITV